MSPSNVPIAPIAQPRDVEPTLGATLRAFAFNVFPSRFHLALQLSIPFAFQFWIWGWKRSAGWMVAASAFGLWALAEQALTRDVERTDSVVHSWRLFALRAGRTVMGSVAALTALGLFFEAIGHFFHFGTGGC